MTGKNSVAGKIVLILVPIYVGRIQELIPYLPELHIAKVSMIAGLAAIGMAAGNREKYDGHLSNIPQVKIIAVLYILGMIGVPFSVWPGWSFSFLIGGFLKLLLFVFLVLYCTDTEAELVNVLWSFVISALLLAIVAVISPSTMAGRVYASSTYDPNDLALTLVAAVPLTYYMMEQYGGLRKIVLIGGLFLLLLVIVKTGSRGGFLALTASATAVFFDKGLAFTLKRLPVIGLLVVLILSLAPQEQIHRLRTMFDKDYNTTEKYGREDIWKRGVTIILHNPILGCGLDQFSTANGRLTGGTWQAAHNAYIEIGAELGFPGLILFIMLISHSFGSVREGGGVLQNTWIVKGLRAGFIGLCVGMIFLSWAYAYVTYFMFSICMVVRKLYMHSQSYA